MGTQGVIGHWPGLRSDDRDADPVGRHCHYDAAPHVQVPALLQAFNDLGSAEAVRTWAIRPGEKGYWVCFMPPCEVAREEAKGLDGLVAWEAEDLTFTALRNSEYGYSLDDDGVRYYDGACTLLGFEQWPTTPKGTR